MPEYLRIINAGRLDDEQKEQLRKISYLNSMNISSEEDIFYFREKLKKYESAYEEVSREMKSAKTENKSAVRYYENYLRTMQSDYDILYELAKRERVEVTGREERELEEFMRREETGRSDSRHYRR